MKNQSYYTIGNLNEASVENMLRQKDAEINDIARKKGRYLGNSNHPTPSRDSLDNYCSE